MPLLETITGPRDLRDLSDDQLATLASEIRDLLVRACAPAGGHLGPNLGVVELTLAIHRVFDSPRDRVVWDTGHQAYVHKMVTGRAASFDRLRRGGRPERLPEPGRVRARHRRELARLHLAELRRRAGQGLHDPRRGPARRRGDRRRRPHRRHGLGGAQQHRGGQGLQAGHRRQRQRPLLHADGRRPHDRADLAAHQPALRAGPRPGQAPAQRRAGRRSDGVRRAARDEEGPQGRRRAAGPLRGPRPEVRRTGRRPRPAGDGAGARPGQAVQRAGDRARDHPQGLRLRRGRAARGRPVPPGRAVRPRDRRGPVEGPDLDRRVLRGDGGARRGAQGHRRHHRRDDAPGRPAHLPGAVPRADLRRRHRRAARRDVRGRAWRWPACTRWSRSTRRSSTGPSTRC